MSMINHCSQQQEQGGSWQQGSQAGLEMDHDVVTQLEDLPCTFKHRISDCAVRGCCCFVCSRLLGAIFVSSIWPVSVLIDGDWLVCCLTSTHNATCKKEDLWTDEERIQIRETRDFSRMLGLSLLLILFLIAFIFSWISNCCERSYERDWLQIVLEEEEIVVSDALRKMAKEQLTEQLRQSLNGWKGWYTVGDEVSKELPKHPKPHSDSSTQTSTPNLCGHLRTNLCGRLRTNLCGRLRTNLCGHLRTNLCGHLRTNLCGHLRTNLCGHLRTNSVDTSGQTSVDTSGQTSVDTSGQTSVDTSGQTSVDTSTQSPVRSPKQSPVQSPEQSPVQSPEQSPVQSPKQPVCGLLDQTLNLQKY
ncbi:hypothetical protein WMY93_024313 [Mugilogobius chulae]|uniref:Uncharacterized protein n=1 Tax=Mugilogobius chulae TaxID=88201 RepID=A0AAW0N0Z1_9GOBI